KDPMLAVVQRQKKLSAPTHLAKEIAAAAMELLEANWNLASSPVRALTVTVSDLCDADEIPVQYSLIPSEGEMRSEKQEKIELAMDHLRDRYGKKIISFGSSRTVREDPEQEK
ncbi:MAG: DNA polymerase IV, partial [Clostridia bacterium]|nr:DNA polymerase IV [Clostridia bacterium]